MENSNSTRNHVEPVLIDTNDLAIMLSVSKKFIEKHRNRIVGAVKIGGVWRYKLAEIQKRIETGKSIFVK